LHGEFIFAAATLVAQWDRLTGEPVRQFSFSEPAQFNAVAVTNDGLYLFAATERIDIPQWRISDGVQVKLLSGFNLLFSIYLIRTRICSFQPSIV
jgi:hypothetical protein